jgi:D-sedoheptulose 7-phosphate isomerase
VRSTITAQLLAARSVCDELLTSEELHEQIARVAVAIVRSLRSGGKLMLAGNGGSAADAQHLACEFVSRFLYDRPGLAAIALNANTSTITAIANDFGFENVFKRQIEALARSGDVFLGISTSGNSSNILAAATEARRRGVVVIGLTGQSGGKLLPICDECICMPSTLTPEIQQAHILIGHILCLLVEQDLLASPS